MSEWERYSDKPLSKEELQKVRLNDERMEEIYPVVGPISYMINRGKYYLGVLILLAFLTSERGRAVISAAAQALTGGNQ